MMRAGIYKRVSTDDQKAEGYSLPEQDRHGRDLAAREGWEVVDTYSDTISGALWDRPQLQRLTDDALAGRIDVMIVKDLSRFSRDLGHQKSALALLHAAGVRVYAAGQQLDQDSAEGIMHSDIIGVFSAYERAKIRERTRMGIQGRNLQTGKPWGAVAFGYRKRADGHWEQHPEEARTVRRVFALYLQLGSYNGAARVLTADREPTAKGGSTWHSSMAKKIVSGRHVLGEYRFRGEWHEGRHEAIIDVDTWDKAQLLAGQASRWTPRGGGRLPARHLLVRGALKCPCSATMVPRTERRRGKTYESYQCVVRKTRGVEACPMPILRREAVEGPMLAMFEANALSFEKTREHIASQLDARIGEATAQAARAEREAIELRTQADRVTRDYRRGALPAEDYSTFKADIASELAAAEAEAERLTAHAEKTTGKRANLDAEDETLARLTALRAAIAGQVTDAGSDVGALRTALTSMFSRFHLMAVGGYGEPAGNIADGRFLLMPEVRPGMRGERVPIVFGTDAENYEHGTVLWKYMTQNTLRSS